MDKKLSIFLLLLFVALVIFGWRVTEISNHPYPLSLDPLFFAANAEYRLEHGFFYNFFGFDIARVTFFYQPALIWLEGFISWLTNISTIAIAIWLGPLMMMLLPFAAFYFFRLFFLPSISFFASLLFNLIPYILWRGTLTIPENFALLFYFIILREFYLFFIEKKKRSLFTALFLLLLFLFLHSSVLYLIIILFLWLTLESFFQKKLLPWVLLAGILIFLFSVGISQNKSYLENFLLNGFSHPYFDFFEIKNYIGDPVFWGGIAGLFYIIFLIFNPQKRSRALFIISLTLPFLIIYLSWDNNYNSFGAIWRERFIPFLSVGLIASLGFLIQEILEFPGKRKKIATGIFLIIVLFFLITLIKIPKQRWFYVYTPAEYEAVKFLERNSSKNAVVFSQPLMNWLLAGVGHKLVVWDPTTLSSLLGDSQVMINYAEERIKGPVYFLYSKPKAQQKFIAEFSNGERKQVGYSEIILPKIDIDKFENFPIIFINNEVTVYLLSY